MTDFFVKRKKRLAPVLLAAASFPAIICVGVPLEIFGGNLDEFLFSFSDFMPYCLLLGLAVFLLSAAILFFLPKKAYKFVYPVFVAVPLMMLAQGTFLNFGVNSLPGDNMEGDSLSTWALVLDTLLWCAVLILAAASGAVKKRRRVRTVCMFLSTVTILTQLSSSVFAAVNVDHILLPRTEREMFVSHNYVPKVMTGENLTSIAGSRNVVVFVVDRFDEKYAEDALTEKPDIYDELEGFTWYRDNISMYGHTFPAVTHMLSGKEFSCSDSREEYLRAAFEGDIPLKILSDAGYAIDVYTQSFYSYYSENDLPDYIENVLPVMKLGELSALDRLKISSNMIRMALYRCLPFAAKGIVGGVGSDTNKNIVLSSRSNDAYSLDMKNVYDKMCAADFDVSGEKKFSFIHVTGCHSVDYGEDFGEPTDDEKHDPAVSVRVSFKIIDRYLSEMKRLGVYDDATIIITGDHAAAISDRKALDGPRLTALFVKRAGVGSGSLRFSSAQTSHEDLWATIFESEGLDDADVPGVPVFDIPERENRTRRYVWHTYQKGSLDEYVYDIGGPGGEWKSWRLVGYEHYDKTLTD